MWPLIAFTLTSAEAAEIKVDWKWDGFATVTALGTYGFLETLRPRDTTSLATPTGLDAWVHPQWNPAFSDASDFLGHPLKLYGLNLPVLSTIGLSLYAGHQKGPQNGLAHGLVIMQAVAINGVITESLKLSISRPRPFTSDAFQSHYPQAYNSDYLVYEREVGDSHQSMPSGHTSTAAATYFSLATLWAGQSESDWTKGALFGTASLLTAATAFTRIKYGMHHPTDTIVGGLLGAGIGFGIGALHLEPKQQVSVSGSNENMQISFGGVW